MDLIDKPVMFRHKYTTSLNVASLDRVDPISWCNDICMLTPGQYVLCEMVKPCPKRKANGDWIA